MPAARPTLREWLDDGIRAGLLRQPRHAGAEPFPLQLVLLVAAVALFDLLLGRLAIPGGATFDWRGWLAPWSLLPLTLLLGWWLFAAAGSRGGRPGLAAWYLLWSLACWPIHVAGALWEAALWRGWLPPGEGAGAWAPWLVLCAWQAALGAWLARGLALPRLSVAVLGPGLLGLSMLAGIQFGEARPWHATRDAEPEPVRLELSQETFEAQQAVWADAVRKLQPQRPGVRDVYGIVYAPYGSEEVFRRESTMVATVMRERFDAEGRVLQLLNHARTTDAVPWATPLNLRRALEAVAAKMDRQEDVLVLYMTSHGGNDFQLASWFWPLQVPALTARQLRQALDASGIRNRVLMVSACYAGGWVEPLADDRTLVMTAADATHTSYGCGRRSELTFFGRAMWDEQLRRTHSFEQAFDAAVPVIRRREEQANKPDGFSNPQMRVGAAIRPVLADLAARLDRRKP